ALPPPVRDSPGCSSGGNCNQTGWRRRSAPPAATRALPRSATLAGSPALPARDAAGIANRDTAGRTWLHLPLTAAGIPPRDHPTGALPARNGIRRPSISIHLFVRS